MKTLLKKIFGSSKFWYALAGVAATIITAKVGLPEEVIVETILGIVTIVSVLIFGQGLSDFGKEKAKIENK